MTAKIENTMINFPETIRAGAFVLIVVGTVGLLANEFVFHWGRPATLWFAVSNAVVLLVLGLAYLGKSKNR